MNTNLRLSLAGALMVAVLVGCSTLKSARVGNTPPAKPKHRSGIAYFLPRVRLNVKASLAGGGGKEPAKDATQINNIVTVVVNNETKPATNAPAGGASAQEKPNPVYQITINEMYEPDPAHLYLLRPQFNALAADTYRVVVSNGLLTTISSTNADKSGEVIVDLAKIGIEAFKLAAGGPPSMHVKTTAEKWPREIDVTFDPTDPVQLREAQQHLLDVKLNLAFTNHGRFSFREGWRRVGGMSAGKGEEGNGFFYRPLLPYTVTLSNGSDGSFVSRTVLLPNEAPILSFCPQRAAFVERVTHVALENGTIKEVYFSKPSELSAAVKIPLGILQSIVALPADLIQLKINYHSQNKALIESQQKEIEALRTLLKSQKDLAEAQAP